MKDRNFDKTLKWKIEKTKYGKNWYAITDRRTGIAPTHYTISEILKDQAYLMSTCISWSCFVYMEVETLKTAKEMFESVYEVDIDAELENRLAQQHNIQKMQEKKCNS